MYKEIILQEILPHQAQQLQSQLEYLSKEYKKEKELLTRHIQIKKEPVTDTEIQELSKAESLSNLMEDAEIKIKYIIKDIQKAKELFPSVNPTKNPEK